MTTQPAATSLEAARAKRLDALHAVVSAACAVLYNDLVAPSIERDELAAALDAEAQAARAVTRLANADGQRTAQPRLVEVA